ncbi:MAG: hypothetical protein EHM45_01990 [Desulfobacteraceae bacterium]|nr:MAG: hypothetical protein EHM45_01990 [Desulfobacteraceae bacterium]
MMVSDEEFQKHAVFADLERYGAFYESLAHSVFPFVSVGTRAICNIDSYVFSSIQGTLASIHAILQDGRINDAYALLRKYYDSAIINIYTGLYLKDHVSIENFIVTQIDKWLQGKDQLPEFRIMSQYIRGSQRAAPITGLLFSDDRYKRLRDRCNDHTHYNFYRNVLLNDKEIVLEGRRQALEEFSNDLRDVLILHLSYLFFANGHYMISSDHIDCLECGMTPEPDSQYWVAFFVQEMFDQTIKKSRPDIATMIKQHSLMHLT